MNVSVVGTCGVGKTSLIEALGGHLPKENPKLKDLLEYELPGDEPKKKVYEYPGYGCSNWNVKKFWNEFRSSLVNADILIIMIDNRILKDDVQFVKNIKTYQLPFIIVRSKSDDAVNCILQNEKAIEYRDASEEKKMEAIQQLKEMVAADVLKVMGDVNTELYVVNFHSIKKTNSDQYPVIDEKRLVEKLELFHNEGI